MKILGFEWPFVTRKTLNRVERSEWAGGHHAGYSLGLLHGEMEAREKSKQSFERADRYLRDMVQYHDCRNPVPGQPRTNSDTVTLFFTDLLRSMQGDEAYARFIAEQTAKAVYAAATQSSRTKDTTCPTTSHNGRR